MARRSLKFRQGGKIYSLDKHCFQNDLSVRSEHYQKQFDLEPFSVFSKVERSDRRVVGGMSLMKGRAEAIAVHAAEQKRVCPSLMYPRN